MNPLLQHLTCPEWTYLVKALLHSLWQASVVAAALALVLRRMANPAKRYHCTLTALAVVVGASLVTWGVLSRPHIERSASNALPAAPPGQNASIETGAPTVVVTTVRESVAPSATRWTAWTALAWIAGAAAMLLRAATQVAGAERVRRSARPLENSQVAQLLAEAQRAMRLTRKLRVAVTDKLTSPAVVGVLVPTLILPLSLITTLTPEQLRFVLLHELAHIQRGDYFANLFQLFTEALLFFNPAVWWISHQARREREVCCDALAIQLSNAPADYARTLVRVAESILESMPAAAPAFGDERQASSLADRVQRLLNPGYRPSLRLTWRAMLAALFVGGTLLILSAVGTKLTVAAILSPQQRIEQIERKMTEYGEKPEVAIASEDAEKLPKVEISGRVRMADGSKLPKIGWINVYTHRKQVGSVSSARVKANGVFSTFVMPGQVHVGLEVPGFAPAVAGPVDAMVTNRVENLDVVLDRGFDVAIKLTDADTKKPVSGALIKGQFWVKDAGVGIGTPSELKADTAGTATLFHCSDSVALTLVVNAPGYEIAEQKIEKLRPQETIQVKLWRGAGLSGVVLNKADNSPIAGATVRMLYEKGRADAHYQWSDPMRVLAKTDSDGQFRVNQLRRGSIYWLGVSAPGQASMIVGPLQAGTKNVSVPLGPELIVRGRVIGGLEDLQIIKEDYCLSRDYSEVFDNQSYGFQEWVPIRVVDGEATFEFTNPIPGKVTLSGNQGYREARDVTAPVNDWVVNLADARKRETPLRPKREVIFRFKHPSGVPPRGTVTVSVPNNLEPNHLTSHSDEKEIINGEVRVEIAIGGRSYIEPKRTVGYWFKQDYSGILVTNGAGPLVAEIPVVPAGAIYAQARNADGTLAGGLFFSVRELKRAPSRADNSGLGSSSDSVSGNAPRKWVSGPLPLGGTYQIIGWRGNSFCASQPITLTEAKPDAEVMLQFPPGQTFEGRVLDVTGQPVRDADLDASFTLPDNHNFGVKKTFTDENGRFRIEDVTPGIGIYSVQPNPPGFMAERVKLDFDNQPQTIRLKPGKRLSGRVVEAGTGYVVPNAEVRALPVEGASLPSQTARTDANGHFEFTTLGDATYMLFVSDAKMDQQPKFRPGDAAPVTLTVQLYEWSKLKPKRPLVTDSRKVTNSPAQVSKLDSNTSQNNSESAAPRPVTSISNIAAARQSGGRGINSVEVTNPPVELTAKGNVNYDVATGITTASNGVVVKSGLAILTADAVNINRNTGELGATGHVRLQRDGTVLTAEELRYNFKTDLVQAKDQYKLRMPQPTAPNGGKPQRIQASRPGESTNLYVRTFRVDPNRFYKGLEGVVAQPVAQTNAALAIRTFLASLGVDLNPESGKSLFFKDRQGILLVRATKQDLDTIEQAIQELSYTPPQINIKAKFVELPVKEAQKLLAPAFTNAPVRGTNGFTGILTERQADKLIKAVKSTDGVEITATPEVTTLSGRQAQMQIVDLKTIVTGFSPELTNGVTNRIAQTQIMPFGSILDVIPHLLADGYTIEMTLIPSVTEFLGYDEPPKTVKTAVGDQLDETAMPWPKIRVRQITTAAVAWDGQTIVLANFPDREITKRPDGTELAKDVGATSRKQLLVFVTPTIVDPAGNRIHVREEMPFAQDGVPSQTSRVVRK